VISLFPKVRQPSGIGSAAYDQRQKDIRAFFSGERVGTVERRKLDSGEAKNDIEIPVGRT
jgi:hypothetical protein